MSTADILATLRAYESRNVTFVDPAGGWPIAWARARGAYVWDAEGRRYLDLTAAFGVAAAGHANSRVVRAGQEQMATLLHAMGDVHPHELKARLARELSRLTFERWTGRRATGKTLLCNSGFEAVEAALKTALLVTDRPGVIAFAGAYHGTGYGALNATHREHFRSPFQRQLGEFAHFAPFPQRADGGPSGAGAQRRLDRAALAETETVLHRLLLRRRIGAVLVEPVQGRGGIRVPLTGFLALLRRLCDQHGALLIVDEIYTGFGRTGKWFACEHDGVAPDVICLGKALTGGFPLSACVGRADVMDAAWPPSDGEAIHTSTFLGHPVGCAMALAQIAEIRRRRLVERSAALGARLLQELAALPAPASTRARPRGLGLMAGLELTQPDGAPATAQALRVLKGMLGRGFILLPEGAHANVLSLTPPLTIPGPQLLRAVRALGEELRRAA